MEVCALKDGRGVGRTCVASWGILSGAWSLPSCLFVESPELRNMLWLGKAAVK